MRSVLFLKATVLAASALWLAGCSSTSHESESAPPTPTVDEVAVVEPEVIIEVLPVSDPAVQAVIDSGRIDESPEVIEAMLDKDTYFFAFDKSKLSGEAFKSLDVHAAYLTSALGYTAQIEVQGHTDERGTRTYNLALGERRANAVKDYLIAKGVSSDRIEVVSYGFEKPLDPEHNETAWALNRRAVLVTR